jgi:hypothetical protein
MAWNIASVSPLDERKNVIRSLVGTESIIESLFRKIEKECFNFYRTRNYFIKPHVSVLRFEVLHLGRIMLCLLCGRKKMKNWSYTCIELQY